MRYLYRMKKSFLLLLSLVFFKSIYPQVPVYEEPRHRVALKNEYLRLIDVNILPHDTTMYHHHNEASVIVFLSRSTTGSQPIGEKPNTGGKVIPGNTAYADYVTKPITHRVWNEDTSVYHVMDIEIFPRKNLTVCAPIENRSFKLEREEKNVRVYNVRIAPGKTAQVAQACGPYLLILISGAIDLGPGINIEPGEYIWNKGGFKFKIKNKGTDEVQCVLLELI